MTLLKLLYNDTVEIDILDEGTAIKGTFAADCTITDTVLNRLDNPKTYYIRHFCSVL